MNKVSIAACVIWVISFALSFVIKPGTPYIWLPDFLLLAGFVPLLVSYKHSWPFFVFALGNVFIGFVLETANYLPDGTLPSTMLPVKDHLHQMHVPMVWILFGIFSALYGFVRVLKNVVLLLINRNKKS